MTAKIFVIILIFTATAYSEQVHAQKLTSNVDPDTIVYDKAASESVADIYMEYSKCLSDAFVQISKERMQNNVLPDMRAKTYEDECIVKEIELYQAFYSASRDYDPDGKEQYAHNTALKGVEHVKRITFEALAEGFNSPPK